MLVAMDNKKTEEFIRALDVTITKYRSHYKVNHIVSTPSISATNLLYIS